jgi:arylsulfatase A-like enzyme
VRANPMASPRLVAGIAILLVVGFVLWHVRPIESRPLGSAEDIRALAAREDLNVLFILIDTLRADRLGSYGYARDTSTTLDRLAEEGIRFSRHLSQCSWTKSSMASLWTAHYPAHTGVHRYQHALPDEARLPAEILRDAGFRTIGIWRNGWVAPNFGFGQGFDTYTRPAPRPLLKEIRREHPGATVPGSDLDATRAALEFLRTVRDDDRWFLYLHLMDVHQYTSDLESARFGTAYSDLYDNAIHWTDRNIELVLADLEARGLRDKTLVVVASDHGEAFREHESEGHARNLYGEVIETPFLIGLPFRLPEPLVVESPSANVDVWPTIFEILGLDGFESSDGRSLLAEIEAAAEGRVLDADRSIVSELDTGWGSPKLASNRILTVTRGPYCAHERNAAGFEVYDLIRDPEEQIDLTEETALRADLKAEISSYLETDGAIWSTREVELDEMQLNQLRALGYKIE